MTGIEIMEIDRVERDRDIGERGRDRDRRDSRDRKSERETQGDSVTGTEETERLSERHRETV